MMRADARLAATTRLDPERIDVVFVCGPYKSGTSLMASHIADRGYADPSRITNPAELGHGTSQPRYLTRECSIARAVNKRLLPKRTQLAPSRLDLHYLHGKLLRRSSLRQPLEYLEAWKSPIVLKDPCLSFTLGAWLTAAAELFLRPAVCFTTRERRELEVAWAMAPVTRPLLPQGFHRSLEEARRKLYELCRSLEVPFQTRSLAHLRSLRAVARKEPHDRLALTKASTWVSSISNDRSRAAGRLRKSGNSKYPEAAAAD